MARLEELIKRDWSLEGYKKALTGKMPEECKKIEVEREKNLRELYLLENILTSVLELFDMVSELRNIEKDI